MVDYYGVIETATGDLLRVGFCDFENDGSFDSLNESICKDSAVIPPPPFPGKSKGNILYDNMHRWDAIGLVWTEVSQP